MIVYIGTLTCKGLKRTIVSQNVLENIFHAATQRIRSERGYLNLDNAASAALFAADAA